jgi:hypothetical protein
MSFEERMIERLHLAAAAYIGATDGTAAATGTGATCEMSDARRALFAMICQGTGTATLTVEYGELTVSGSHGTDGYPTAYGTKWSLLTHGTATATVAGTKGQIKVLEVPADHIPDRSPLLRARVGGGSANTYATVLALTDGVRYGPADQDDSVETTEI